MKKFLKGLMAITLVLIFLVALTGCGKGETSNNGGNDNKNSNGEYHGNTEGANDLKHVSNSNYKEVTKAVCGIELKDISGWTIKKAESINSVNDLQIMYDVTNGEDAKIVLEYFYNQCKNVSKDGIYEIKTNYENYSVSKGTKYDSFENYYKTITKIGSLSQAMWIYDNNGKNVQMTISINKTYAKLSFSLLG